MKNSLTFLSVLILNLFVGSPLFSQQTNPFAYLDRFCDPYYPHQEFAKLTTPQWIGEEGVDAVITFGIDDMRDPARYEAYLRPILNRLKKIDGRAPVSIMTCHVDPKNEQLKKWLAEGLSIECHTVDHPCPCLQGGDFSKAKDTYDRCVDLMNSIPGNRPVAFRFPCMDSLNTPSPRGFSEIINQTTPSGNFLQISSSVTCLFTSRDPDLANLFRTGKRDDKVLDQTDRFRRYIPFPSFVNRIDNYPYPYVVGGKCWEFPCTIPDDWQGQNIQRPNNPATVADLKAALDATVIKKGIANIVFHPHGWIRAEQVADVIDYIDKKYGKRVKFLTFRECSEKINRHLLKNQPIRSKHDGTENGVRVLDLNHDGYMDVFIGNPKSRIMRVWNPTKQEWREASQPFDAKKIRFGSLGKQTYLVHQEDDGQFSFWRLLAEKLEWEKVQDQFRLPVPVSVDAVRLRDLDGDQEFEVIVAAPDHQHVYRFSDEKISRHTDFPAAIVDKLGNDNGLRFVDLDGDSLDDLVLSNDTESGVFLFDQAIGKFKEIKSGVALPPIVSEGKNNGAWFANKHLWIQNEHTNRLPDGVGRRPFQQIIAQADPNPRTPKQSLRSIKVRDDFQVELMAAEPLVQDPIAIEWGVDGKLWVVEMADYPLGIDDQGKPGGRIRYLEDTDQDGQYDKSTLFVDQIPFPTGVFPVNRDPAKPACLISAAPYVVLADRKGNWNELLKNTQDPAKVSDRVWLRGFGEGNQQHRFNGFSLGLDNWFYLANGDSGGTIEDPQSGKRIDIRGRDLRFRKTDALAMEAQTGQTQFGRHRDDWGNWFGCSNPLPIRHYILDDQYLGRNPHFKYPNARNDLARADNTELFPRSRILSHWSGYRPPGPGQSHRFTSACSTNPYRDELFGKEFNNNIFTCEPVHNLVHRRILEPDGLTFQSRRPVDESENEFLASSDSWFRPTFVTTGPDGALWITDMYRLVIEHPEWIDDQREKELFLRAGHDKGRIYRVFKKNIPLRKLPGPHGGKSIQSGELLKGLASPNRWQREMSQYLLVNPGPDQQPVYDQSVTEQLRSMAQESKSGLTRLQAACTLQGRGEMTEDLLVDLLSDDHPAVRRHAIRMSEEFLAVSESKLALEVCKRANDSDPHVLLQLAYSLGFGQSKACQAALSQLGHDHQDDVYLLAAVTSSLNPDNIGPVLQHARSKNRFGSFELHLCEQAVRMNQPHLALATLDKVFAIENPAELTTRNLEQVVQLFSVIRVKGTPDSSRVESAQRFLSSLTKGLKQKPEASLRRRIASIELMGKSPFSSVKNRIGALLDQVNSVNDVDLQTAAVKLLGEFSDASIPGALLAKFRYVSPKVQDEIFNAISARAAWTQTLLDAIDSGKFTRNEVSSSQRRKLTLHGNPQIAARARKLFAETANSDRGKVIQKYRLEMKLFGDQKSPGTPVSIASGRKLFEKNCSKCHQIGTIGTAIGPDLGTVKDRSPSTFLLAILDPNSAVEQKFRNYLFGLKDGREISGMIESETSGQINVASADGKRLTILRAELEKMKSTPHSFMPEGLERDISPREMDDLLQFLLANAPTEPPKVFAGNQPKLIRQKPSQKAVLSATNCEIFGPSLVFESKYGNLGFWAGEQDIAKWKVEIAQSGEYNLWMNYACPDQIEGNQFVVASSTSGRVEGRVKGTGTWDDYKRILVGKLNLKQGRQTIEIRPLAPMTGFLMDLKELELTPTK